MKKHINTFKNFSIKPIHENWNDDDYFRLLNVEFETIVSEWIPKIIDVTKEDFNLVTSCLDNIKYEISILHYKIKKYISAKRKGFSYKIFRLSDEWFMVIMCDDINGVNLYYLCDQIEGLEYFLNKR